MRLFAVLSLASKRVRTSPIDLPPHPGCVCKSWLGWQVFVQQTVAKSHFASVIDSQSRFMTSREDAATAAACACKRFFFNTRDRPIFYHEVPNLNIQVWITLPNSTPMHKSRRELTNSRGFRQIVHIFSKSTIFPPDNPYVWWSQHWENWVITKHYVICCLSE